MAHTTHAQLLAGTPFVFQGIDKIIRESWALAVEWYITGLEYKSRGILNYGAFDYSPSSPPNYPNHYGFQYWEKSSMEDYTTLFINLIDNFNEYGENIFYPRPMGSVNDQVYGYTLPVIESVILPNVGGLASLSSQLKAHKPSGVTNAQIDLLIGFY